MKQFIVILLLLSSITAKAQSVDTLNPNWEVFEEQDDFTKMVIKQVYLQSDCNNFALKVMKRTLPNGRELCLVNIFGRLPIMNNEVVYVNVMLDDINYVETGFGAVFLIEENLPSIYSFNTNLYNRITKAGIIKFKLVTTERVIIMSFDSGKLNKKN